MSFSLQISDIRTTVWSENLSSFENLSQWGYGAVSFATHNDWNSNQKRTEITVRGIHIDCDGVYRIQRDDVTILEVKHPSSVQSTFAGSWTQWLYHGNAIVVYANMDSPAGHIEKLCVDVISSRGGHSQFSVVVPHTACQVAVRGADRPVLYYLKEIKKTRHSKRNTFAVCLPCFSY